MNEQEQQLPAQARTALEKCFAQIRFARATELAQSRRFVEAEAILSPDGKLPESPRELDLLARIAIHDRRFGQAKQLWEQTLKNDPTYEPARAALAGS